MEECLQRVQYIGASPTAKESADTLYSLAKVVDGDSKQRKRFRLNNSEVLARKVRTYLRSKKSKLASWLAT